MQLGNNPYNMYGSQDLGLNIFFTDFLHSTCRLTRGHMDKGRVIFGQLALADEAHDVVGVILGHLDSSYTTNTEKA